jgi:ubiquinone/menaquinone biosynthesis C-methylase UbiE
MADLHREFQNTAAAPDPRAAFRFLDRVDGLPSVIACKERMREHLDLAPGGEILDVGCGVGHEAQRLADLVGPGGRSVGLDKSGEMIAEARRRTEGRDPRATFLVGDAESLDLGGARFSGCRTERVLMYAQEPSAAVRAMIRVLAPGGKLVCFEFDYDAMLFDAPDLALTRRIIHALSDSLPSGLVGRQLPRLFREAGLRDLTVEARLIEAPVDVFQRIIGGALDQLVSQGELDRPAVEAWVRALIERSTGEELGTRCIGLIVSGRKP